MNNTIVEANKILLRRKNKLIVGNVGHVMSDDTQRYLVTMTKNIETLGYTFSNQLFNKLKTLTKEELFEFYKELVSELKRILAQMFNIIQCIQTFQNLLWKKMKCNFI